jgi:sugar lactone lactonase YvrE
MSVVRYDPVPVTAARAYLGESPRWDARWSQLLWVDIEAGRLFREEVGADLELRRVRTYEVGLPVGSYAPIEGAAGWILAAGGGFAYLQSDGTVTLLDQPDGGKNNRMNDAVCDPQGRFWGGTIAHDLSPGAGTLYRLDRDGTICAMANDLTCSNGIGWTPDGTTMYLVDSTPRVLYTFDFDGRTGDIDNQQVVLQLEGNEGVPDGLIVDDEGCLWIGVYGGWEVRRYTPDLRLLERIRLPVRQVTACCFGGADRRTLFVTTARENFTEADAAAQPLAGAVFAAPTSVRGPPAQPYRPAPGVLTAWRRAARG